MAKIYVIVNRIVLVFTEFACLYAYGEPIKLRDKLIVAGRGFFSRVAGFVAGF